MALPPTWNLFGDDHLPHRLQLLARMIDRESARQLMARSGLTLAEWRVLAFVGTNDRVTAADICVAFDVDRAEVSRAVARLSAADLVQREEDDGNRKRLLLKLTDQGATLFRRTRDDRVAYFHAILEDMDDADRQRFDALLLRVARRVDAMRTGSEQKRAEPLLS